MRFRRTYVTCSLLGVALIAACEDEPETNVTDSGVSAMGGPGGIAAGGVTSEGTTTGAAVAGGMSGAIGGFPDASTSGLPGASAPGGPSGETMIGGTGGAAGNTGSNTGGNTGGNPGGDTGGMTGGGAGSCPGLPPVTDYAAKGPFDVKVIPNAGPDGTYYLFRPDATLGKDGFKHPVGVWGNGILTTPDQYQKLLGHIASHGFVIIACPSTMPERPCLHDGMEWLVQQNDVDPTMKGKLDTSKELTIGYSWGGGAAIDTANRPNVRATVSLHGMPPREVNAWTAMKSPLLLFTSVGDTFVSAEERVTPNYNNSQVPTFYATLQEPVGHLYPIDENAISCLVDALLGGPCAAAVKEQAPIVAWLRLWACDDQNAKKYFYGSDCTLCKSPWSAQNKPSGFFQ
jgi:hypothetical protein